MQSQYKGVEPTLGLSSGSLEVRMPNGGTLNETPDTTKDVLKVPIGWRFIVKEIWCVSGASVIDDLHKYEERPKVAWWMVRNKSGRERSIWFGSKGTFSHGYVLNEGEILFVSVPFGVHDPEICWTGLWEKVK